MASDPAGCGFIKRTDKGNLVFEDGRPFRFVLLNAYYLQEEAARGRIDLVDETFSKCVHLGVTVVRAWAFNDDPNKLDSGIQRRRLFYSTAGLLGLDRLLERARAFGLRLVLPLVNYWNAYGGVRQWLLWNGVHHAREGDPRFFTDPRLRDHFAGHVERLLERKNSLSGLRYGDDAMVLAWELMNEPRGRGLDETGGQLADWVSFAAREVKTHARQLVAVGDEGEEISFDGYDERFWRRVGGEHLFSPATGTSFQRHLACDGVDLATCHFYPEKYGIVRGAEEEAGCAYFEGHARLAARAGKPLLVEEFGLYGEGVRNHLALAQRRRIYARWFEAARRSGIAGVGPWLFAYDSRPDAWDDFTFYLRDGSSPEALENRYADIVSEAARALIENP